MNRGLQSLRMIINITSLAYELTASPRANTRNDTLPYPDHALLTGRLRRCSWERFRAAGRGPPGEHHHILLWRPSWAEAHRELSDGEHESERTGDRDELTAYQPSSLPSHVGHD